MATESSHKKRSDEQYAALLKHELCHAFVKVIVQGITTKEKFAQFAPDGNIKYNENQKKLTV